MSGPVRVQRKRSKGWRMPPNTVSVCRPGPWGNPFRVSGYENPNGLQREVLQQFAVDDFKNCLFQGRLPYTEEDIKRELRGRNLACWCREGAPCHADVLLEIANADPT